MTGNQSKEAKPAWDTDVNTSKNNNVAFRLPEDHLRELNRLAAKRGQSKGRLAKDIVTAAMMDFDRFDELSHRLGVVERGIKHLIEQLDRLDALQAAVDQSRASSAAATSRLLVDAGNVDFEEAIAWTKETFGVREDS